VRKYPTRQNLDDLGLDLELPEEMDDEAIALLFKKWSMDPISWCRYFFPHYFTKKSPAFHYEIARNWRTLPNRLQAYEAPRGFAKTTLAEFLMLHSAVFDGTLFIIFISQVEERAADRLIDLKHECENNSTFRLFFGDLVSEKWGEKELVLRNDKAKIHCKMLAKGLGQTILGSKYLEKRPQLIVIDDPEDMKIAENPNNVDKNERWLIKEVEPSLDENGRIIMISTPVTAECLIERQRNRSHVFFQRFSAMTDVGVPLWQEHKSAADLAELKRDLSESGHLYVYFTEYLCNPLPPDRHPITEDMLKSTYSLQDMDLYQQPYNIFILIDLAIGKEKRNCFSALVVIAVDPSDTWYILDTYQIKADWYDFAKDVFAYRDKWNPIAVGVEEAACQRGFWDVLRLTAEKWGYKHIYPIPMRPDKDKNIRVDRLLPRLKTGRIKFLKSGQVELKQQLILHPDSKFNDLKDCLAYGEVFCYPPGAQKPKEQAMENWRLRRAASDEEVDEEYRKQSKLNDLDSFDVGDLDK